MPAAAVASFTPAMAGISGTSVGARGETVEDIGELSRMRAAGAALYHLSLLAGRGRLSHDMRKPGEGPHPACKCSSETSRSSGAQLRTIVRCFRIAPG